MQATKRRYSEPASAYPHPTKAKRLQKTTDVVPRILIMGAGYRGHAYAGPIHESSEAILAAVVETSAFKRKAFGDTFIWGAAGRDGPREGEEFESWEDFIKYETSRREKKRLGMKVEDPGVDAVFVCVLDELHAPVIKALAPLGLHIMCEKPLATTLEDIVGIYAALMKGWKKLQHQTIFAAGFVLRYSSANMLLRKLVREERVVGDVVSVEHTDMIGWWHFVHSYVRGNWRKESASAPSLLTKSSHDIDFLMWLLCSPTSLSSVVDRPHLPSRISSFGRLHYYRRAYKPLAAGTATNCLSCPIEPTCLHSAKSLYLHRQLEKGDTDRPVNQVVPEIEDLLKKSGKASAAERLLRALSDDYDESTPAKEVSKRNWFGRCAWECDNDVCDDQIVTMEWDDDPLPASCQNEKRDDPTALHTQIGRKGFNHRTAKTVQFHMAALTDAVGSRRGRISGTAGEISYDSTTIRAVDFRSGKETVYTTPNTGDVRNDRDERLTQDFIRAVATVKNGQMGADEAQRVFLGCTVEDLIRSHLVVFWAEAARRKGRVLEWREWWERVVEGGLKKLRVEV